MIACDYCRPAAGEVPPPVKRFRIQVDVRRDGEQTQAAFTTSAFPISPMIAYPSGGGFTLEFDACDKCAERLTRDELTRAVRNLIPPFIPPFSNADGKP